MRNFQFSQKVLQTENQSNKPWVMKNVCRSDFLYCPSFQLFLPKWCWLNKPFITVSKMFSARKNILFWKFPLCLILVSRLNLFALILTIRLLTQLATYRNRCTYILLQTKSCIFNIDYSHFTQYDYDCMKTFPFLKTFKVICQESDGIRNRIKWKLNFSNSIPNRVPILAAENGYYHFLTE